MPEDDDSFAPSDEPLHTRRRSRAEWALAIGLLLLVFVPALLYFLGQLASVTVVLLPPFALGALAVFVYAVWGKKILRARRIAGIRERRLLDAAAQRDRAKE